MNDVQPVTQRKRRPASDIPGWLRLKERGSRFWLRVMCRLSLVLGRRLTRSIVYVIAGYFLLAAPGARNASRAYLTRCLLRPVTWLDMYRHTLAFASTIHDRVYLLNDQHDIFDIRVTGADALQVQEVEHGGCFLFGGHLGSFEVLRALARDLPQFRLSIAMYPDNAQLLNSVLTAINPRIMQDIIALGQLDSMLTIHRNIEAGAMVGLLADRTICSDQYITLALLGTPARLSTGPFRMAVMLRHPVYFMAGLYRGGNRYDVHFELLTDFSQHEPGGREAEMRQLMEKYAATLQHHCQAAPYNWFNFYDFWESARSETS